MHIGIDIRSSYQLDGAGRYVKNLIRALEEIDKFNNRYSLFTYLHKRSQDKDNFNTISAYLPRLIPKVHPYKYRDTWDDFYLPKKLKKNNIEVFHGPNFLLPREKFSKMVVTIHDLAFKYFEDWVDKATYTYYNQRIEETIKQADMIIAVSLSTKKDIIKFFNIHEEKIRVIYSACDPCFCPIPLDNSVKYLENHFNIRHNSFILYVGAIQPRKNIGNLLLAYSFLDKAIRKEWKLFILGKGYRNNYHMELEQMVKNMGLLENVVFLSNIDDSRLNFFYNAAGIFVYPSLFEGFGLPVLEAMSCKLPVIVSKTTSLPEIVNDAGMYVDPTKFEDIFRALAILIRDKERRKALGNKALERSKLFSWKATAYETIKAYKEA
ncbi:MAG: glycosyltransferase family 1 protein [bacterium]